MTTAAMLADLTVLAQVLLIDLMLAGDNAVVVGLAVAGLPPEARHRAILLGIAGATAIRIFFALVAVRLLAIVGLLFAGGVLLLWVCWRMFRELSAHKPAMPDGARKPKSMRAAMTQIILADLSMSLDNVLAVAGAAHGHPYVLAAGLLVSVVLMGAAANLLARLLEKQRWIAWLGLLIVLYVALKLMRDGYGDIAKATGWHL
jgi:YjbE family integral membrane protein